MIACHIIRGLALIRSALRSSLKSRIRWGKEGKR
jgi:hypothetical protein